MDEARMRQRVVDEAMMWIGTPYHHHAQIRGVGVDCAHLLIGVYQACGRIPAIDPGDYATDWHLHHSDELFVDWMRRYARIGSGHPIAGDALLFRFGRTLSHGAIYIGDDEVVHAYIGMGVIRSRFDEAPIAGRERQHWSMW